MLLKNRVKKFKNEFHLINNLINLTVNDYVGRNLLEVKKELENKLGVDDVIYYDQSGESSYNYGISGEEEFWGTAVIVGKARIVYDDMLQFSSDFETIYVDIKVETSWDYELDKPIERAKQ